MIRCDKGTDDCGLLIIKVKEVSMELRRVMAALCLAVVLGCGPSGPAIVPVTGIVTLDGAPVAGAGVMFAPVASGRPAIGTTDAEGKFSLTTDKANDGAMEGDYAVTVTGMRPLGVVANPDGTSGDTSQYREEWFVPKKYSRGDTSGLSQTVTKGMPPVELKLTAK